MVDAGVVAATVLGGAAGGGAGWAGRRLLCKMRRGVRAPSMRCEAAVAVLWATVVGRTAGGGLPLWWFAVPLLLGWLTVVLTACDVLAGRLPDALTLPAYPVAAAALGVAGYCGRRPELLYGALAGTAVFAGTYAVVRWVSSASMGPGDVKLAGSLGAVVGAVSVSAVLLAMLAAAALTLVSAWRAGRVGVAHGPAMLVPAWLVTVFPPGPALQGGGW